MFTHGCSTSAHPLPLPQRTYTAPTDRDETEPLYTFTPPEPPLSPTEPESEPGAPITPALTGEALTGDSLSYFKGRLVEAQSRFRKAVTGLATIEEEVRQAMATPAGRMLEVLKYQGEPIIVRRLRPHQNQSRHRAARAVVD